MATYQYIIKGNFEQIRQAVKIIDRLFRSCYNVYGTRTSYKKTCAIAQLEASWSRLYGYAELHKAIVNKLNRLGYTCENNTIWAE